MCDAVYVPIIYPLCSPSAFVVSLYSHSHLSYFSIHMCGALYVFILIYPVCPPSTCVVLFMCQSFILCSPSTCLSSFHLRSHSCLSYRFSIHRCGAYYVSIAIYPMCFSIHMCAALYGPIIYPMFSPSTFVELFPSLLSSWFIV